VITLLAAASMASLPPFDASSYAAYREAIVPAAVEPDAEKVAWWADLWSAAIRANAQDKPILLFAMNGHPMGCT
jgi:hypothetical protein